MSELAGDISGAGTVLCVSCEYDLRGLPPEARCPECGAQVERSRQHHEAILARGEAPLWMSQSAWQRRMGIGCALALASGASVAMTGLFFVRPPLSGALEYVAFALWIGSSATMAGALWLLGSREPAGRSAVRSLRLLRAGAILTVLSFARPRIWNPRTFEGHRYLAVAETLLMAVVSALLWARFHRLARRSNALKVTRLARRLTWLLPAVMVVQVIFFNSVPMARGGGWLIKPQVVLGETFALTILPMEISRGASIRLPLIFWTLALITTGAALATLVGMMLIFFREAGASASGWNASAGESSNA
jgi:hypothetical protein